MNRTGTIIGIGVGFALVAAWLISGRRGEEPRLTPVSVHRGDLVDRLVQIGELAPRDPVLVKVAFNGRLQFIVEEGIWVDEGDSLFAIAEDDAVREAADLRGQLLAVRQDLRLSRLKRETTVRAQDLAVAKAERALHFEQVRMRILTESPKGGDELLRIDAALKPLEQTTAASRAVSDKIQARWQKAQDAYLEAVDERATSRDRLLRLVARLDELRILAEREDIGLNDNERAAREKAKEDLPKIEEQRDGLIAVLPERSSTVHATRDARDAITPERDAAAADLAAREMDEEELRIHLEIEKAGLSRTQLRLDAKAAELSAEDARRAAREAKAAFDVGALSQAKLDEADEDALRAVSQLEILRARIAIAEKPLAPEELIEAKARLARVEQTASAAREDRERAIAQADQEIALNEAKTRRIGHEVEIKARNFPEVLESTIAFLKQELTALDAEDKDDAGRIVEAKAELADAQSQLVEAMKKPANIISAPVAGVVRLAREGDRPKQAGDQVWDQDPLCRIYPPGRMDVVMHVNQVDAGKLAENQDAQVEVPAFPDFKSPAVLTRVGALGRDKFTGDGPTAGVIQFEAVARLIAPREGLLQGMTALVTIDLDRRDAVLWLPLGAVRRTDQGWQVLTGEEQRPERRSIEGEPFGDDAFVISAGLADGERIWVEYVGDG